MKKLISILGAIGIIASSSTSVIACGGHGDKNNTINPFNPDGKLTPTQTDTMNAVGTLSEVLLATKTENLGLNRNNPIYQSKSLYSDSLVALNRFQNALSGQTIVDGIDIGEKNAATYSNWKNNFQGEFNADGTTVGDLDESSFIKDEQLHVGEMQTDENGNYTAGNEGLTYLLTDQTRGSLYKKINNKSLSDKFNEKQINNKMIDGDSFAESVKDNASVLIDGQMGTLLNPNPNNAESVLKFMSNIAAFTLSGNTMNATYNDDGTPKEDTMGYLESLLFGSSNSSYGKGVTALGEKVGPIVAMYEQEYLWLVNNKDKAIKSLGENVYNYLVGTKIPNENGKQFLINHLDKGDDGSAVGYATDLLDKYGYGYMTYKTTDGKTISMTDKQVVSAPEGTGFLGEMINQIGNLKFHSNYKVDDITKNGEETNEFFRIMDMGTPDEIEKYIGMDSLKGGLDITNGINKKDYPLLYSENFALTDNDVVLMMKNATKLYQLTKGLMDSDTFGELVSSEGMSNSAPGYLKTFATALGLTLDEKTTPILFDFVFKILNGLVQFDSSKFDASAVKGMNNEQIENLFNGAITDQPVKDLIDAAKMIKSTKYSDDSNLAYREKVNEVFGFKLVDGKYSWREVGESGLNYKGMVQVMSDQINSDDFQSLTSQITGKNANNFFANQFDKGMYNNKNWKFENINFNDNGNQYDKIEFDIIYEGQGNEDVTQFKVDQANSELTQTDILNKTKTVKNADKTLSYGDENFGKNYNGTGLVNSVTQNVKHKYHIVWENEGTGNIIDFKLADITSSQAIVSENGDWVNMII